MCTTPVPLEFYACICEEVRTTVGVNFYTRTRTNEISEMEHVRMVRGTGPAAPVLAGPIFEAPTIFLTKT